MPGRAIDTSDVTGSPAAELALRLAAVRRRRRTIPGLRPGLAERAPAADARRRRPPGRAPHARAQPPHAGALRRAARGAGHRAATAPGRGDGARRSWPPTPPPTSAPTACTARQHRLPPHRAALLPRGDRQRPPAGLTVRRPCCSTGPVGPRLRAAHPASRRLDPGALRRRPRRLPGPARPWRRGAGPPRAALGGHGRRGGPGRRRGARSSFPVGGYHVQRSGWGDRGRPYADERFGLLDCGPIGDGGHGHYDQLSVELYAAGRALVVDPGRYTYDATDGSWRRRFKGTAAHNTVTVDDLDQTPYRAGKPRGPLSTARLLGRATRPGLDVLRGEVRSPATTPCTSGRWRWSTTTTGWCTTGCGRRRAASLPGPLAPGRRPGDAAAHPRTTTQTSVARRRSVSWCRRRPGRSGSNPAGSPTTYGVKLPAPVVTVTADPGRDADLVTVLLPGARAAGDGHSAGTSTIGVRSACTDPDSTDRPVELGTRRLATSTWRRTAMLTAATALAADPLLPGRDALLDPECVGRPARPAAGAGRAGPDRAAARWSGPSTGSGRACGWSTGSASGPRDQLVAARDVPPGHQRPGLPPSHEAHDRAPDPAPPGRARPGAARGVVDVPERSPAAQPGRPARPAGRQPLGLDLPGWCRSEVVEYAPERSATFRAEDADGRVLAYAKATRPAPYAWPTSRSATPGWPRCCARAGTDVAPPGPSAGPRRAAALLLEPMPGRPGSATEAMLPRRTGRRCSAGRSATCTQPHRRRSSGPGCGRSAGWTSLGCGAAPSWSAARPDLAGAAGALVDLLERRRPADPASRWCCTATATRRTGCSPATGWP